MENRGNREIFNHKEHKDHKEKSFLLAPVFVLSVLYVVKSLPYLWVDSAGGARPRLKKSATAVARPWRTGKSVTALCR